MAALLIFDPQGMNFLDIILIIPLLWAGYRGFRRGFIIEVFGLLALVAGIYGAIHFSDFAAGVIQENLDMKSDYVPIAAFALTFIGIVIIVHLLGRALTKVIDMAALGMLNRVGGVFFSVAKMLVIMSFVVLIFHSVDEKMQLLSDESKQESTLYPFHMNVALTLMPAIENSKFYEQFEEWRKHRDRPRMPWEGYEDIISSYDTPRSATMASIRASRFCITSA